MVSLSAPSSCSVLSGLRSLHHPAERLRPCPCLTRQPNEPRPLWASNRVCEAAARHKKYEHHLHNLRNVKPSIDNRDPRRPRTANATAARMKEERNQTIMHENTILLNKLSKILTREPPKVRDPMLVHGLNEKHRRAERERIDRENQALLRRLQNVRPSIDAEAHADRCDCTHGTSA